MQNSDLISKAEVHEIAQSCWLLRLEDYLEKSKPIRVIKNNYYNREEFMRLLKRNYPREIAFDRKLCQDFLRGKFNPVFSHN